MTAHVGGLCFVGDTMDYSEDAVARLRRQVDTLEAYLAAQARVEQTLRARHTALAATEATFRSMFEHAVEGIFQSTPDGRYLRVNPALARIYGYATPDELMAALTDIGRQLYVDPSQRARFARLMDEHGIVRDFEAEIYRRDGTRCWIIEHARAVRDLNGRLLYYEGTVQDSTARRAAAAAEQARQVAEAASAAKSALLAQVSHELRTPLSVMLGFAQLLTLDTLSPAQSEHVQRLMRAGQHLRELVNELLDVARIEAGRLDLTLAPVALAALVGEVVALMQPLAAERGLAVAVEVAPLAVLADEQRLRQVLFNLLANAIKCNRPGGQIAIHAVVAAEQLTLTVADTGVGLTPAQLERLFLPFERLGLGQAGDEGTGLGLALSKGLIEAMGGAIGARSAAGAGSEFWITLPVVASLELGAERWAPAAVSDPAR